MSRNLSLRIACLFFSVCMTFSSFNSFAQQTSMVDYVLFAGFGNCPGGAGQSTPSSPGCGVVLNSSTNIQGGSIGSYRLINSTGNATLNTNLFSGGTISLANSNAITGRISAANNYNSTGNILTAGSSLSVGGNVDVKGKIFIGGGTVTGRVTQPSGFTYSGPAPVGGRVTGAPTLALMPAMPVINVFPACGFTNFTNTCTINPGNYGNIALNGGKTITFSRPGTYVFRSIKNTGNTNSFVFNFNNDATGVFRIYIDGDAELGKVSASMINGGSASRIFSETHGKGSTCWPSNVAWSIANGSSGASKWLGTVWAPYGTILIGSGTGSSDITGALWSGTQISIQSGVKINYEPFVVPPTCTNPVVDAGANLQLTCDLPSSQLRGTSSVAGTYNWTTANGNIVSGANTLTPTVNKEGKYFLTVTNGSCSAKDSVLVTFVRCIIPYYPPPDSGKVGNIIGSELSSLSGNFGFVNDSAQQIFILKNDSVLIEVIALQGQYNTLKSLLLSSAYGLTDTITNGPGSLIITGKYPISKLKKLDSLPNLIDYCRPLFPPLSNAGIITSQGDKSLRSDFVRAGYEVDGENVKVGVISDSYNTTPVDKAAADILNGDLPGIGNTNNPNPVEIVKEYPFGTRSDEGRAMLQIVHDIAPKAKLAFRTGFISAGDFAQGITQLQQQGCDVIVDDVTFITEPFFRDGVVAKAVDQVTAQGVSYFSAAGNFGTNSYSATFNPGTSLPGTTGPAHNFANGDIFQQITLTPGTYTLVLQWEDLIYSLGQTNVGSQNDLDIFLTDNNGTTLFGFNRNNINGDPIEVLPFTVTQNTTTNIVIVRASGTQAVRFKYIFFRGGNIVSEHTTGNSTIVGQANAAGAMAVGAVLYSNTPAFGNTPNVASFSSRGGTPVNGIVRNKPDFVAPNGVNTTVPLGGVNIEPDDFPNFFGTSAAAPHAAGVAALLLQGKKKFANQTITPAQMRTLLQQSALPISGGFNFAAGAGFVQSDAAMRTIATPSPSLIKLVLADSSLVPGRQPMDVFIVGDYLDTSSKVLFRDNNLPATVLSTTTIKVTIPTFNGNPSIKVFTPPISSSGVDGGLSNTLFFSDVPRLNVVVKANPASKKYGEKIPSFSSRVTVNGVRLDSTTYTLAALGIDSIYYNTTATPLSSPGFYTITPSMRNLNPAVPFDAGLLETFNYTFETGVLTVTKMPLVIIPKDRTITYGDQLADIGFTYHYDSTNIPAELLNTFQNQLANSHQSNILNNTVALVNRASIPLVNSQLENLSFLVSAVSASKSIPLVNSSRSISIQIGRAHV